MKPAYRKILAVILAVTVTMTYSQIGFAGQVNGADKAKAGGSVQAQSVNDSSAEDVSGQKGESGNQEDAGQKDESDQKEAPDQSGNGEQNNGPDQGNGSDQGAAAGQSEPTSQSDDPDQNTQEPEVSTQPAEETAPSEEPAEASSSSEEIVAEDSLNNEEEDSVSSGAKDSQAKGAGHSTFIETGSTALADGEYKPDSFTFTGGTGKVKITCDKVIVSGGKAKAVIRYSSTNFTHLFTGTVDEKHNTDNANNDLYNPSTGKTGKGVYATKKDGSGVSATVPASFNQDVKISGRTVAMSEPHWITYTIRITSKAAKDAEDAAQQDPTSPADPGGNTDPTDPASSSDPEDPKDPADPTTSDDPEDKEDPAASVKPSTKDPTPTVKKKLTAGTWKVKATTCRVMFYLYPKEKDPAWVVLKIKKDKTMTATITLNGDGYDYVYMGTPSQAKKAGKKNWIKGKVVNGYYTFTVPVKKLDKKLNITPHSKKYASDGDVTTEPWRPDKWIIFYSNGAKKVKSGTTIETETKKEDDSSKDNDGSGKSGGTQTTFSNDNKADTVSKLKDDSGKSTGAVDNSTSLADGVYTPDKFSWSGGSGRLAYIRCNKITVKGGKAYATIEFSSSKYDSLKASGNVYSKQGGGNSTFVIPVKLNANNTIIGRTTAMSQPHWIKYTIYIYKAGATDGDKGGSGGTGGTPASTEKLTDKAPDLMGMKSEGAVEVKNAKYFKIFKYEQDIVLVSIDQSAGTALEKEKKDGDTKNDTNASEEGTTETDTNNSETSKNNDPGSERSGIVEASFSGSMSAEAADRKAPTAVLERALDATRTSLVEEAYAADATEEELEGATAVDGDASDTNAGASGSADEEKVEYDEDGKPIAKTDSERTNDLYQNEVVNYLIVPEKAELPAGLEKDCVIIKKPVEHAYVAAPEGLSSMEELSLSKTIGTVGMPEDEVKDKGIAKAVQKGIIKTDEDYQNPDFRQIIKQKTDLVILPSELLPQKITEDSSQEEQDRSKELTETLQKLQTRYSALNIPMIVDRSSDEKDSYGQAEWIKVYGAIFGEEKAAEAFVEKFEKEHKNEKSSNQ